MSEWVGGWVVVVVVVGGVVVVVVVVVVVGGCCMLLHVVACCMLLLLLLLLHIGGGAVVLKLKIQTTVNILLMNIYLNYRSLCKKYESWQENIPIRLLLNKYTTDPMSRLTATPGPEKKEVPIVQ